MTKTFVTKAIICLLAAVAGGCQAVEYVQPSLSEATLRKHMEFLASAELRGRKALEPGSEVAANYVAAQFRQFGLTPGAGDSNYFQPVPVETFEFQQDQTVLVLSPGLSSAQDSILRWGEGVWVFPRKKVNSVSGKVCLCGYGIRSPEAGYDDYRDVNVSGKLVMIFMGEPETDDTTNLFGKGKPTRHGMIPVKAKLAEELGALGIILTAFPSDRETDWQPALEQKLGDWDSHIMQAEGDSEFPVIYFEPQEAAKIIGRMAENGWQGYKRQLDSDLKGAPIPLPDMEFRLNVGLSDVVMDTTVNVIGRLEGDSTYGDQVVIVGAHYDHIGVVDGQICYGADDNASGVSGLLALVEALTPVRRQIQRSVLFAAFGAEEEGLIGSRYYVNHPVVPLAQTFAMINMDCIGREGSDSYRTMHRPPQTEKERNLLFAFYSADYPDLKDMVSELPNPGELWIRCDPLYGRFAVGDHASFQQRGVPVLFFFSGYHGDYHTPNDTIDKIVFPKMAKITALIYDATIRLTWKSTVFEEKEAVPSKSPSSMY